MSAEKNNEKMLKNRFEYERIPKIIFYKITNNIKN
jgi:hypothetical protein